MDLWRTFSCLEFAFLFATLKANVEINLIFDIANNDEIVTR